MLNFCYKSRCQLTFYLNFYQCFKVRNVGEIYEYALVLKQTGLSDGIWRNGNYFEGC